MLEEAIQRLGGSDTFQVIDWLDSHLDPTAAAKVYAELANHLYWKSRDIPKMVAISRAGIQYCLSRARQAGNETDGGRALRGQAKGMAYNLGANTWPGWDEKGIHLNSSDAAAGLDAARLNFRLAIELKRDAKPIANAHWLLGAHLLSAGDHVGAHALFAAAIDHSASIEDEAFRAMLKGYSALNGVLQKPDDAGLRAHYSETVSALRGIGSDDGTFFADQLETALAYFSRKRSSEAPAAK